MFHHEEAKQEIQKVTWTNNPDTRGNLYKHCNWSPHLPISHPNGTCVFSIFCGSKCSRPKSTSPGICKDSQGRHATIVSLPRMCKHDSCGYRAAASELKILHSTQLWPAPGRCFLPGLVDLHQPAEDGNQTPWTANANLLWLIQRWGRMNHHKWRQSDVLHVIKSLTLRLWNTWIPIPK